MHALMIALDIASVRDPLLPLMGGYTDALATFRF